MRGTLAEMGLGVLIAAAAIALFNGATDAVLERLQKPRRGTRMLSASQLPTLRKGHKGPIARALLCFLRLEGHYPDRDCLDPKNPAGAEIGNVGHAAMVAFQRQNGLVPDGVFGPESWAVAIPLGFSYSDDRAPIERALDYALGNVAGGVTPELRAAWMREMDRGNIKSKVRQAAFLSQVAAESGQGRYTAELWGNPPSSYQRAYDAPGNSLGNLPGEGHKYRGRGFIQVTGRSNLTRIGGQTGLDLITRPELGETPINAMKISVQWWINNRANNEADKYAQLGEQAIRRVSRLVNSGNADNRRKSLGEDEHRLPHFRALMSILEA